MTRSLGIGTRCVGTDTICPAVIGGVLVHRDRTHLTNTFAVTLAPYLGDEIAGALDTFGGDGRR